MKIAIGADHGATDLKKVLTDYLTEKGHKVNEYFKVEGSVDYPDVAEETVKHILNGENDFGILLCGTGIGISIAANKIDGIRAALCTNEFSARMAKIHNNANVICMGGRVTGTELAKSIIDAYLSSEFEGGRHKIRVDKITNLE